MKAKILDERERRRRWSTEEKARIVGEATAVGAHVAEIARLPGERRRQLREERRAGVHRGDGVTSELDVWQSAKLLVDQHGADAPIRAAQRAGELLAAGDIEGCTAWLWVLEALKELMATSPPGSRR